MRKRIPHLKKKKKKLHFHIYYLFVDAKRQIAHLLYEVTQNKKRANKNSFVLLLSTIFLCTLFESHLLLIKDAKCMQIS
jgi:hypothetical protein